MVQYLVSDCVRGILRQQAVVLPFFEDYTDTVKLANRMSMGEQSTAKGDRVYRQRRVASRPLTPCATLKLQPQHTNV